jgi:hypothetical protein
MEVSTRSFGFPQALPAQPILFHNFNNSDNGMESIELDPSEEHPLMAVIRGAITKYRLQSAAHFDVLLNVKQAIRHDEIEMTRVTKLGVSFVNFHGPVHYVCRPVFRKHPGKKTYVFAKKVQVIDNGHLLSLNDFLKMRYPCFPCSVRNQHMQKWWAANGKIFDWAGLPTELKEQVIQSCMDEPLRYDNFSQARERYNGRSGARGHVREQQSGIYEIADKLTAWAALLAVSHQVRTITLRLCFMGSNQLSTFGITASSCYGLHHALERLGRYYQVTEPHGLPVDDSTQALANSYRQNPRIFPQLKQYATFRHAIRRIHMGMDFISSMHFFKVTIGGFDRYLYPGSLSFEVFDQLPNLNEITIRLPRQPHRGWRDKPGQRSPRLFYDGSPCPRILHRIIYERIAKVLTLYVRVKVVGFVDDDEKARFDGLRASAMKCPEWTAAEYEQLYVECGGGVDLQESVQPGDLSPWTEDERQVETTTEGSFFPPKCRCVEKCHLLFTEKEKKRR